MALVSRHINSGNGSTVGTFTFSGAFNQVSVVNRSTNDIYFTSLVTQGTASDGVPTVTGNNTYVVGSNAGPSCVKVIADAVGGGSGTDYVTISYICAVTNSPFSIIAE